MNRHTRWTWALAAIVVAGCSGDPRTPAKSRPSLLEGVAAAPAYTSPATWSYHPPEAATLRARLKLADGRTLFAGDRGERWLVGKKPRRHAQAAARLAPEDLVAILEAEAGGWLFVGESGGTYEAVEPLGPFVRSNAPLDPLARLSAGGRTIVGVEVSGKLVRSGDAGASWETVGPEHSFFVDVALTDQGKALALAWPEQLLSSDDAGQSWKPIDQSLGALALRQDERAGLVVVTALDVFSWSSTRKDRLAPLGRSLKPKAYQLPVEPERGPNAQALAEGRAVIFADRYLEVARSDDRKRDWELLSAPLGDRLEAHALPEAEQCRTLMLAGYDQHYYLACFERTGSRGAQPVVILRSSDAGKSWKSEPYSVLASADELDMAVGSDGALVVTGICPAELSSRGCKPHGVYYRREAEHDEEQEGAKKKRKERAKKPAKKHRGAAKKQKKSAFELALAATPTLAGAADRLAFSTDGKLVYAVGRRNKNQAYAVFVSADGGQTFQARELEQLPQSFAHEPEPDRFSSRPSRDETSVDTLAAAEDGSLAIVFTRHGSSLLIVTDQQGRVVSVSSPPEDRARVGAVGMRALAFSPSGREAWESLDGGASWESIGRMPLDPCNEGRECETELRCYLGGCVIGDQLSRVGWRGQADDELGVMPPPERRAPRMVERKVRAPLSCTLNDEPWRPLSGVAAAPDASQAAKGEVSWYATSFDDSRAQVSVFHATGATIEPVTLLEPTANPERHAVAVVPQHEGVAALRYPVVASGSTRITGVEVAWDDVLHSRKGRARVADAGVYRPGDYVRRSTRTQLARPDLVSVASDGVFLRIHDAPSDGQDTLFLDGRRVERIPPVDWPAVAKKGASDMARVDGTSVPFMRVAGSAGLIRAVRDGSRWRFDAHAIGLDDPGAFAARQQFALVYLAGKPAMNTALMGRYVSKNLVFPLRASGAVVDPPIMAPLQQDTADRPSRCSTMQKTNTPRVVSPYQPGTRHPVVVIDPVEPVRVLLTGSAVMHGTPRAACVAAFDAQLIDGDTGVETQNERAILPVGDLEHSWLFRSVESEGDGEQLEVRGMTCTFDPTLEVPLEVYGQPGTTRTR